MVTTITAKGLNGGALTGGGIGRRHPSQPTTREEGVCGAAVSIHGARAGSMLPCQLPWPCVYIYIYIHAAQANLIT